MAPWDIGAMTKSETASQKLRETGGSPRKGQGRGKRSSTPALEGSARRPRAKPGLHRAEGWELSEVLKGGAAACSSRQAGRPSAGSDFSFLEVPEPRNDPRPRLGPKGERADRDCLQLVTALREGVGWWWFLSAGHWVRISPRPFFSRRKQKNRLTKNGY